MRRLLSPGAFALAGAFLMAPVPGEAQVPSQGVEFTLPGSILNLRLPNGAAKSLLTPTGWGAAYNTVYGGGGYQREVPFVGGEDADWSFGIGLGDPVQLVGIQLDGTILDLTGLTDFIFGAKVHRYLGGGTSVAVGVETLFETLDGEGPGRDPGPSFYAAVSHTVQSWAGTRPGVGRMHLSLGLGSGRFAEMPLRTEAELGKKGGTVVFGNAAMELAENWNLIGEWDGIGLNAGMSYAFPLPGLIPSLVMGIADITGK